MANEELENLQPQQQELRPEDQNMVEAMQQLKANSVQKSEYERVLARNKELTEALARNAALEQEAQIEPDTDTIESLRSDLSTKELSNRVYWEKSLKFRDKCIDAGLPDPMLPSKDSGNYSLENINSVDRVVKGIQKILDEAQGNDEKFNALYQAYCEDLPQVRNKNNRR